MRKFKTMIPIVAAMLVVALLAVACSPDKVNENNDTINAYFGALEAKTFNADEWTITSTNTPSNSLAYSSAKNFYWAYKATKQDDGNKTGQTDGFVNVVEGKGLDKSLTISKGTWIFELKAYGSEEARTAGTNPIYTGTSEKIKFVANGNIEVPLEYMISEGNGGITLTASASLDLNEAAQENGVAIEKIVAKLTPITGTTEKEITLTANGSNYTGSASDVPNGFYDVSYQIYIDGSIALEKKVEKVIIYKDMATDLSWDTTITIKDATVSASLSKVSLSTVNLYTYGVKKVGESGQAGGIIFYDAGETQTSTYVNEKGETMTYQWRYLETIAAVPSSLRGSIPFGYYRPEGTNTLVVTDTTENAKIGSGRSNTRALVNAMGDTAYTAEDGSDTSTTESYAAKVCDDYSVTFNGTVYDDWFLPSIDELDELYKVVGSDGLNGNDGKRSVYLSSSEKDGNTIMAENSMNNRGKEEDKRSLTYTTIRPVRAFL